MFYEVFQVLFQDIVQIIPYEARQDVFLILGIIWEIIKAWWWLPLPFILWGPLKYHYAYFIQEKWDDKIKRILLEIKIPKEIAKPIRAMEQVFAGFHSIYDPAGNFRERWIEGQDILALSLEIVSIEGKIHFYIRTPEHFRNVIQSSIFSQYPDAEISLVDDYTKNVPQDIPNKDWDIWARDIVNLRSDAYPIRTYKEFETEVEKSEEKKIDPMSIFLEGMSTLKQGEQIWFQIRIKPVHEGDNTWQKEGKKLVDKLARRPEKAKSKSMLQEAIELIISGPPKKKEDQKEVFPPEMKLTPGEKEIITAVERKLEKLSFESNIRFSYLAKKDVFLKPKATGVIFSFLKELSSEKLGAFKTYANTATKVKSNFTWFLDNRRVYQRKRRIFRYYINRLTPMYPRRGATFVLNIEELATLFHFPSEAAISTLSVPRVEARRKEAPINLPIE